MSDTRDYDLALDKVRQNVEAMYTTAVEEVQKAGLEIDRLKQLVFTAAEFLEATDLPEARGFALHIRRVVTQDE